MPNTSIPRIVVSGLRGGSGKTILSLCLIASWHKKGLAITPFKKGPDYIDAGWLAKAANNPCCNLDLFMMSPEKVIQSFISHANPPSLAFSGKQGGRGGIIAVIEGNRGLYDGVDHKGTYSTAQLAKLLNAPVIMVVDCTKATTTIAAMVLGCQKMAPAGVKIRGVVLNRAATARQESLIRKAITKTCKLPVVGAIPRLKHDPFPERHMGLVPFQEHLNIEKSILAITEIGEKYLDLDGILEIADKAALLKIRGHGLGIGEKLTSKPLVNIGVVKDSAFQFYYQENFEELQKRGAKLIDVSPLKLKELPDIDALYIGGGFPETHAIALSENIKFKNSLVKAIEKGLPVYAECGGFMYLGKSLFLEGKRYPMAGVLPVVFGLEKKPQAHGYTIIKVDMKNPYFPKGSVLKGHEFHYSKVLEINEDKTYMAFKVKRGNGIKNNMDGLCYNNVLATYTHLHALGTPEWADGLVRCAREYKEDRGQVVE